MSSSISAQQGNSATISLALTNADGTPYNASGCTLLFEARKLASTPPVISKTVSSFSGASHDHATIALSPTDTDIDIRAYRCKLTLTDTQGHPNQSQRFYLYITEHPVSAVTTTVVIGSDSADIGVTVPQPPTNADKYYRQDFGVSTTVNVVHNLQKRPSVTVVDSAGDEVECDVQHLNDNELILTLAGGFSGSVFCN